MPSRRARPQLTWEQTKVSLWIKGHRGMMTKIAMMCDCSPQLVSSVAYGKDTCRPGHPVERALKAAGCPVAPRRW